LEAEVLLLLEAVLLEAVALIDALFAALLLQRMVELLKKGGGFKFF
jgi:hypothetical protein